MALRDGDWKLLASRDFPHFELYDLEADPRETMDLKAKEPAAVPGHAADLETLNAEVEREGPDWWSGSARTAAGRSGSSVDRIEIGRDR